MLPLEKAVSSTGNTKLYRFQHMEARIKTVAHLNGDLLTVSASTMVGCPLACSFCHMGSIPAQPLSPEVILGQVREVLKDNQGAILTSVRFDVSGDPLLNWPAVECAARHLSEESTGLDVLVCTAAPPSKFYPNVYQLGKELSRLSLQVSVHASTETERVDRFQEARLLPLSSVVKVGEDWMRQTGRPCSFNYALNGLNTTQEAASRLGQTFPPEVWRPQITPTYLDNPPRAHGVAELCSFKEMLQTAGYHVIDIYFPKDALELGAVPGLV